MKLKQLESHLSSIKPFQEPNYELEQYPTSAHLAARVMHTAWQYGDIEDKAVGDFGCGTGMFVIASQMLGACYSLGVDIDGGALATAQENVEEFEVEVLCHTTPRRAGSAAPTRRRFAPIERRVERRCAGTASLPLLAVARVAVALGSGRSAEQRPAAAELPRQ